MNTDHYTDLKRNALLPASWKQRNPFS